MVIKINRDHASLPITQYVTWEFSHGAYVMDKRIDGQYQKVALTQPFAMDAYRAKHGWDVWIDVSGKKARQLVTASISSAMPAQPDGGTPCYTIPVNSSEIGHTRELIVKGVAVTSAFADWFDVIAQALAENDELMVPVVSVTCKETEFGNAPHFDTVQMMQRPTTWPAPIVNFR